MPKRITRAQPIQYMAPLWQVVIQGPMLSAESLTWLNKQAFTVIDSQVRGWGVFGHIVEIETGVEGNWQYLAQVQDA